jgi:hypothetical protein
MSDSIKLSSVTLDCPNNPTLIDPNPLDFYVDDLDVAEGRVLAAGATKYDFQPNDDHCYVFADPAGHPFCLTTWDDVPS